MLLWISWKSQFNQHKFTLINLSQLEPSVFLGPKQWKNQVSKWKFLSLSLHFPSNQTKREGLTPKENQITDKYHNFTKKKKKTHNPRNQNKHLHKPTTWFSKNYRKKKNQHLVIIDFPPFSHKPNRDNAKKNQKKKRGRERDVPGLEE